jgi:hypothetical protein
VRRVGTINACDQHEPRHTSAHPVRHPAHGRALRV